MKAMITYALSLSLAVGAFALGHAGRATAAPTPAAKPLAILVPSDRGVDRRAICWHTTGVSYVRYSCRYDARP